MDKKVIFSFIAVTVVVLGGIYWFSATQEGPVVTTEDGEAPVAFAQGLTDAGATFYGAFWCPHCSRQKAMFGDAVEYIDYVECEAPAPGRNQTQICMEKNIVSYPTWIFADGSRLTGVQTFEALAEKTSVPLPGETETDTATSSDTQTGTSTDTETGTSTEESSAASTGTTIEIEG